MLSQFIKSGKTILIINPKLGDKVITSNTDSTLNEYRLTHEQTLKDNKTIEDPTNPAICQWHFYKEKSNDPLHSIGYRIKLTHQHVSHYL